VSTDEQGESRAGLEAQRAAILAEAERRGWRLLTIVEDVASGRDLKRPGIAAALEELRHHRADGLVVAKVDRLSRSTLDFAKLMDRATRERWALIALDVGDATTASGEAMANMLAVFARFERRQISERTRRAMAARKAQGARFGRERQVPADVVERIVAASTAGRSLRAIAAELDADGIPTVGGGPWRSSTIQRILAGESATTDGELT
jgi:DNA invertase Pin-like site-specific DNA recombinase